MTTLVTIGTALLLAWALVRRPQWITVTLACVFGLAVIAADMMHGAQLRSVLMGFDALVAIVMWFLWGRYHSERAALVATLAFIKIWLGIAAAVADLQWVVWASANNAVFILMVLIAGGFLDGIIAWVGRCYLRVHARRASLRGYLEKVF